MLLHGCDIPAILKTGGRPSGNTGLDSRSHFSLRYPRFIQIKSGRYWWRENGMSVELKNWTMITRRGQFFIPDDHSDG